MSRRIVVLLKIVVVASSAWIASAAPATEPAVGPMPGGTIVPTSQLIRPYGTTITYGGRPKDLCLSPGGKWLYIKNGGTVSVIDPATAAIRQEIKYPGTNAGSMHGIVAVLDASGVEHLFVTSAYKALMEGTVSQDGQLSWTRIIDLPGPKPGTSHALGIAISPDCRKAYVCLSRNNTLGVVDLVAGKLIEEIPVGVCPYSVAISKDGATAVVSNFGGRQPVTGDKTAKSDGTDVVVDSRTVASTGSLTRVDLRTRKPVAQITTGLHPTQVVLSPDGKRAFVAAANSDEFDIIDLAAGKVSERVSTRPEATLPFGSLPNALAMHPDGKTLYIANGGNNAVAVVSIDPAAGPAKVLGFVPAGWFPTGVATDGKSLYVANNKGEGSRPATQPTKGYNSTYLRASVNFGPLPAVNDLPRLTEQVKADARVPQTLRAMEVADASAQIPAKPVPTKVGEPSVFKHVVYVIKENRTYDQVLGDIGKGNSDPRLCIYGREVTPNHHALAEQFALLDNYYCNGVVSADGHQWATQGMVSEYQEKDAGGGHRSYDFGTDALCYANCNFIWDSILLAGLSFRNFGEFDFPDLTGKAKTWYQVQKAWGTPDFGWKQSIEVETLRKFSSPDYPGWEMQIPDCRRMEIFLKEFAQFEKSGAFPNLTVVYLPQDHTQGNTEKAPSPRAHVADNDLALGQMVEAISKSQFWKDTVIFVNEDDPQNGFDHVDGHRSFCLVVSPYTKRGAVVSKFYNQSSVLHTITKIFGLPPLNQLTAAAPTMDDCFTDKPDLTPFKCVPNQIPLDEPGKKKTAMTPRELKLAAELDFSKPDIIDDDDLNELLWLAARPSEPYPKAFSGAHGKGLKALGLQVDPNAPKDIDD